MAVEELYKLWGAVGLVVVCVFCKAGPGLLVNIGDTTQISECLNVPSS